jgi:phosphatidate cytidylyltransferase
MALATPADETDADGRGEDLLDEMEAWSDPGWGVEAPAEEEGQIEFAWQGDEIDTIPDFADFTSDEYVKNTTEEYAGLAAEVARSAREVHELSPVAAEIPGIESGVLGLDDVIAASGGFGPDVVEERRSDLPVRVTTGIGLVVLFVLSLTYQLSVGLLIVAIMLLAAGEFFAALVRSRYRPLTLFGLGGTGAALLSTWVWGVGTLPTVLLLTSLAVVLFYAISQRPAPLVNMAVTLMVVVWVGGLGSFAMEIVDAPDYRWLIGAFVVTVGAMDIAQYFFGRRFGRRPLAPRVSPKKTLEGLIAGVVVAIGVGALWGFAPPLDLATGLTLGVVVSIVAPFGDLGISVIKRALGLKDMGTILPGHGGALDRIDAMIVALPAAWMVFAWAGVL